MTPSWTQALAVILGASLGALARWLTGLWLNPLWTGFPLGTVAVNVVGGFLIGALATWLAQTPNEWLRLLLITGFLGGLTTFSSYSAESLGLLQRGDVALAFAHTATHVLASLAAAASGAWLVRAALS